MLRAISEIKPTYVVGENVRGLTNWNGGMVFEEVCVDLESQGYTVQPILLPGCAVGAPHRRDRIWFVAYSKNIGQPLSKTTNEWGEYQSDNRNEIWNTSNTNGISRITSNSERKRFQSGTNSGEIRIEKRNVETKRNKSSTWLTSINKQSNWQNFPTQSPICGGDDGLPTKLDGITFSKWRQESIKGYGNAIVPQVAYEIFKVIAEMDRLEILQLSLF
jgi:DNA (cytosine-5)-methyltransferase 1